MRLLLDTHALIWWLIDNPSLTCIGAKTYRVQDNAQSW